MTREAEMNTQLEQLARKTNQLARVSLVLGVCSILSFAMMWCGAATMANSMDALPMYDVLIYGGVFGTALLGLVCLICGIVALVQFKKLAGHGKGVWMAITGIVLGSIECAVFLLLIAFILIVSR
jgi:hypothetical protein